jgi:hypothetical protein
VVERERQWLVQQLSKEREAYRERDTGSLMEPALTTHGSDFARSV